MKQTKTKRILLALTMMLLVLTLGLGLFFMQPKRANADDASVELVPLADAELQATAAIKNSGGGKGVWWDANHTQMRLYYKVANGAPTRLSKAPANQYRQIESIELTIGETTKSIKDWGEIAWADNMGANNGDVNVGEIWINGATAWLESIQTVHYKVGFAEKNDAGADTDVKTTKEYSFWNGGDNGWLTRADTEKGLDVTYTGKTELAWGENLELDKITVKATPVGAQEAVAIAAGCYSVEYDPFGPAGAASAVVHYQDMTSDPISVQRQAADLSTGLEVLSQENHDCGKAHKADWDATQMSFFVQAKGEDVPVLTPTLTPDTNAWRDPASHVTDCLLINGEDYSKWGHRVAWINYFQNQTSAGEANVYEIWLAILQDAQVEANKAWKNGIKTVTFKAGFHIANPSDPDGKLVVKQDTTLWNAHDAGWQKKVGSISATLAEGTEELTMDLGQQLSAEELAKLTVKAEYVDGGSVTLDNSKLSIELPQEAGKGEATITYQDVTCKVAVNVKADKTLTKIEVKNTEYTAQRWTYPEFSDLEVYAYFGDSDETGTKLDRTAFTVSGYDMWTKEAATTATVTYDYNGEQKTATFSIKVVDNTTADKYFNILTGGSQNGAGSTEFTQGGRHLLSFKIEVKGIDLGYALGTRNSVSFERLEGLHLVDYIEFIYNGEEKSLKDLLDDGTIKSVGTADSGAFVFWFKNAEDRAKVSVARFKAGLEWPKQVGDCWNDPNMSVEEMMKVTSYVSDLVLKKEVVLFNGVTQGWLKGVTKLTAEYDADSTIILNGEPDHSKLTVMATYYDAEEAVKLNDNDFEATIDASAANDQATGVVTYRGIKAEFTAKVVAPEKALESVTVTGKGTVRRFESSNTATGFTLKAKYSDGSEVDVTDGYTIAEIDAWAEVGNEQTVKLTYKDESGQSAQADIVIVIGEPDTTKGLEVLCDYDSPNPPPSNWSATTWGPTDWGDHASNNSQLLVYFRAKGDVTLPASGSLDQFGLVGGNSKGTHILDYILINGKPYDEWKTAFGYTSGWIGLHSAGPQGTADGTTPYAIWFNPGSVADNSWRETIVTVTIKAGFQWASSAGGDVAGAVVKQDITIYNAHDAGWQRAADSVEVKAVDGAKFVQGTEDIKSLLEVNAVFGTEKKPITNYTISDYEKDTLGKQTITVSYQDKTATLEINVEEAPAPAQQYDVTFALGDHAAANETAPAKQTAEENSKITLPDAPKAAEGYEFDGWYDGATKAGDAGAQYTVTKAVTLTAHWKESAKPQPQKVTVTFNLNGATGTAPAQQTIDKGAKATKPATDPTREGYTFGGWYKDADCKTEFKFDEAVNEDTTVYAKWTKSTEPDTPDNPDKPNTPENPDKPDEGEADNGCGSVIGGTGIAFAVITILGAAVLVILAARKKKNN